MDRSAFSHGETKKKVNRHTENVSLYFKSKYSVNAYKQHKWHKEW